jgi:MFS family permease
MTDGSASRTAPAPTRARLRAERAAVSTVFAVNGALFGNWVPRIPAITDLVHASPGLLGVVLLCLAGGGVVAMPYFGRLCARRSSTRVVPWAGVADAAALPLVALAAHTHSPAVLALALFVFGAAAGATDVSMNANAVAIVRRAQRPLMPGFHALYSVGGMVGAGMGSLAIRLGLGLVTHFVIAAALGAACVLAVARWLAPDRAEPDTPAAAPALPAALAAPAEPAAPARPRFSPRSALRRVDVLLLVFGGVALCSGVAEGAMADWTALFLRDVRHTSDAVGGIGYAAFAVAMAVVRFSGGAILTRWAPAAVLVAGSTLTAVGILVAIGVPVAAAGIIGFAAVGAGSGFGFPIALNAAGAHRLGAGPAIGIVTTLGYTGILLGPPLIGGLSQLAGLRVGLAAVAVVAAIGGTLAYTYRAALLQYDPSRLD